jgi:hypothetical protein
MTNQFPTRQYKQRGNDTPAVQWLGKRVSMIDVGEFIRSRFHKQELRDDIQFFETEDRSLLVYVNGYFARPIVLRFGDWLVDQGVHISPWGWVQCEPERFKHLYEDIDPPSDDDQRRAQ